MASKQMVARRLHEDLESVVLLLLPEETRRDLAPVAKEPDLVHAVSQDRVARLEPASDVSNHGRILPRW